MSRRLNRTDHQISGALIQPKFVKLYMILCNTPKRKSKKERKKKPTEGEKPIHFRTIRYSSGTLHKCK